MIVSMPELDGLLGDDLLRVVAKYGQSCLEAAEKPQALVFDFTQFESVQPKRSNDYLRPFIDNPTGWHRCYGIHVRVSGCFTNAEWAKSGLPGSGL